MSKALVSIIYGLIAGGATLIGIAVFAFRGNRAVKYSHYFNSFAAGAILSLAFFHLLPHAMEQLSEQALLYLFAGFIVFYFLEALLGFHSGAEIHYSRAELKRRAKGMVLFWGLFLHSLIDGVIISVGFEVATTLGILASLGIILHELPEGITTFSLLRDSLERKKALSMSIAVALATPIGASFSLIGMGTVSPELLGIFLAFAGGAFIYIAASDLIPETHGEKGIQNSLFLLSGAIAFFFLSRVFE